MKSLMDCPERNLCDYFTSTILQTKDFSGTRPRATIKTTNLRQWHGKNCIVKVFLLSEREISPNYTVFFIIFRPPIRFICERTVENKPCNLVAITVSVQFGFGFGVYVKRPLKSSYCRG